MSKKLLPLAKPPITTFPSYAAALGIMANYEESYDWFYSQYIQLCTIEITNPYENEETHAPYIPTFFVDTDMRRITHTFSDYYFVMRENCPFLSICEVPNSLINVYDESFVEFIKKCIDLDMYIFTFLDVTKIGEYKSVSAGFHEIFIYGYDDEKSCVYFADFPINDSSKYGYSTCPYLEVEEAYYSMNMLPYPIVKSVALIKYTNEVPYVFNMDYVINSVKAYMAPDISEANSYKDYVDSLFYRLGWKTKVYMGCNVYDFLTNYIKGETARGNNYFSTELFHGLYDHKEMMIKRVQHFISKGYLPKDKYLSIKKYYKIRDNALLIRNCVIKYNLRPSEELINKILELLKVTYDMEIPILYEIFDL